MANDMEVACLVGIQGHILYQTKHFYLADSKYQYKKTTSRWLFKFKKLRILN